MNTELVCTLFEEVIALAEEEAEEAQAAASNTTATSGGTTTGTTTIDSYEKFVHFIQDFLPEDIFLQLQDINGGSTEFLEDIYHERIERKTEDETVDEVLDIVMEAGSCLICERKKMKLTRHHVFPREIYKSLIKKGYDQISLNTTIAICRMCHSTIHRFFTNDELAERYYTVELLLQDEKFYRFAQWASAQSNRSFRKC